MCRMRGWILLALCVLSAAMPPPVKWIQKSEGASSRTGQAHIYEASMGVVVTLPRQVPYEDALTIRFQYKVPTILGASTQQDADRCPPLNKPCLWELQLQRLTDFLRYAMTADKNATAETAASALSELELRAAALSPLGQAGQRQAQAGRPARPALPAPLRRRKRAFWSIAMAAAPLVAEYLPKLVGWFQKAPEAVQPNNAVMKYAGEIPAATEDMLSEKLTRLHGHYKKFKENWDKRSQNLKKPDEDTNKTRLQMEGLQVAIQGLLELVTLDAAVGRCLDGHLSPRLVRYQHLTDAVRKATRHVLAFGAEPIVGEAEASALYDMRAVSCSVENDKFVLDLHLPLKRKGEVGQIIHLHPAPFKVKDVTCFLIPGPIAVALLGQRPFFFPIDYCKNVAYCRVPRDKNPTEVPPCLTAFFPDDELLTRPCEPTCHRSQEPVITESGESEFYVVTDDQYPLQVSCGRSPPIALPEVAIGATVIQLPCDCAIEYGAKTLVTPRLLCDQSNSSEEVIARNIVPIQWTKRVPLPFVDMVQKPPLVHRADVLLDEEDEVEVRGEEWRFPGWAIDMLVGVLGAAVVAIGTALRRLHRRASRRRNRRASPGGPAPGPAGPTGPSDGSGGSSSEGEPENPPRRHRRPARPPRRERGRALGHSTMHRPRSFMELVAGDH